MRGQFVVVESPFAAKTDVQVQKHIEYARACIKDCLRRGEYPFASHLLYTQPGILDDNNPEERKLGIDAGLRIADRADLRVVYLDYGMSTGMQQGCCDSSIPIEYRSLGGEQKKT